MTLAASRVFPGQVGTKRDQTWIYRPPGELLSEDLSIEFLHAGDLFVDQLGELPLVGQP